MGRKIFLNGYCNVEKQELNERIKDSDVQKILLPLKNDIVHMIEKM